MAQSDEALTTAPSDSLSASFGRGGFSFGSSSSSSRSGPGGFSFGSNGVQVLTTPFGHPPASPSPFLSERTAEAGHGTSPESVSAWRARISENLKAKASPVQLALARQQRQQRQARQARLARQAERLQDVNSMSSAATFGCYASFGATPDRGFNFGGGSARAATASRAFGSAAAPQSAQARMMRVNATTMASPMVSSAAAALSRTDDVDEDELSRTLGATEELMASAGHAWAMVPIASVEGGPEEEEEGRALTVGERAREAVEAVTGDQSVLEALLAQLKDEPSTDEERAAKFALYESHAETLGSCREALFSFWEGCKADFPAAPTAATESLLRELDGDAHAGLDDYAFGGGGGGGGGGGFGFGFGFGGRRRQVWFVYGMAKKATANEGRINAALSTIRGKLEQLSTAQDCPCCLEPILQPAAAGSPEAGGAAGVTLGCAHQLCGDCYTNWVATCRANRKEAFCPLCRNDEFVADLLDE